MEDFICVNTCNAFQLISNENNNCKHVIVSSNQAINFFSIFVRRGTPAKLCAFLASSLTNNLTGLNEAINACYPNADHQKCIVHQIRNSVKHVSYKAPNGEIGFQNLQEFGEKWDNKYSYIAKSWIDNWSELSTFWKYPEEIRRLIYTTKPIESFNRNMRKYTKNKPIFQSEESLAKSLFLAILKVEKKWTTKAQNWGIIYSQLTILFSDRLANYGSIL